MDTICVHKDTIKSVMPQGAGCGECLKTGDNWIHLRLCLACGQVGCCDSSPNQHAKKHALGSGHPVVQSFEPGETWKWCYSDEVMFD